MPNAHAPLAACPLLQPEVRTLQGLPPAVGQAPRILILGSMPGAESLRRQEYYGHPRNHFWRIVEDVFGVPRDRDYPDRLQSLLDAGVAVWDVLATCRRHGSLDTGIEPHSIRSNDIAALLSREPSIGRILFNGVFAETMFRKHVAAQGLPRNDFQLWRMPSTSPANAARPYAEKLALWSWALRHPFAA